MAGSKGEWLGRHLQENTALKQLKGDKTEDKDGFFMSSEICHGMEDKNALTIIRAFY